MSRRSSLLALWLAVGCSQTPPAPVPDLPRARALPSVSAVTATPLASVAPATASPPAEPEPDPSPPPALAPRRRFAGGGERAVAGKHGVVTSSEAQATRAGVAMLERGGNAVDAAVATAFALAVTHPSAGNLGGGGFLLLRRGEPDATTTAIDFRETAPAALTRAAFDRMQRGGAKGGAAAGVPGSVAGLLLAHERFGALPREVVLEPAVALATRGFLLAPRQAELLAASFPSVKKDPTLGKRLGSGDEPKRAGARIVMPELGAALVRIQKEGAAGFYTGPTALALTRAPGSLISLEDLASYRAVVREPLRSRYRGLEVETMPPPSAGGVALTELLGMLELSRAHEASGAVELHLFLEACRRSQAERRYGVMDPDAMSPADLRESLERFSSPEGLLARAPIDPERATPSARLAPLFVPATTESEQTTHLGAVDASGMAVSLTTTLSASFGAKLTAPGTGIVLNNSVASFSRTGLNQPVAGRRTTSSMAPTFVLDGGRIVLVLGTPGGDTIPSTIAQVLRNVVDHGMPLDQAIAAPRVHQSFLPDRARFEARRPLPPKVIAALKAMGHDISGSHLAMGDSNDILLDDEQAWGVADPRGGGLAAAAQPPEKSGTALVNDR